MPTQITVKPGVIHPLPLPLKKFFILHEGKVTLPSGKTVNVQLRRRATERTRIVPTDSQADPNDGEDWECQTMAVTAVVSTGQTVLLNSKHRNMYPGAIYDIKAIADGSYNLVQFSRKPLILKIDNVHAKQAFATINNPSSATVQQAINTMVGSQIHPGGSLTYGKKFKVLSEEDYYMRTGGSGHFLGFGGSHNVETSSNERTNKYILEIYQAYYTISVDDSINEPREFFYLAEEQNPRAQQPVPAGQLNPNWVCVDSVTYGRMLHVMFESNEQLETLGLDVEAWAQWGLASGEANLSYRQKKSIEKITVTVIALGGDATLAGQIVAVNTLAELEQAIKLYFGGTFDEEPIAYSLRTLDGEVVGASLTADYTSRDCRPVAHTYEVCWQNLLATQVDDAGGNEEVQAFVRIRALKGDGSDYVDEDKRNQPLAIIASKHIPGILLPWSFIRGKIDAPINLSGPNDVNTIDQKMVFRVDPGDANARIRIEADVVEFDGGLGTDDFTGATWEKKVADIGLDQPVKLTCSHDLSRIEFNFVVTPIFD